MVLRVRTSPDHASNELAVLAVRVPPIGGSHCRKSLVPGVGVEPTRLSSVDFESTASANSATRAFGGEAGS
jgi:hypothetical protein